MRRLLLHQVHLRCFDEHEHDIDCRTKKKSLTFNKLFFENPFSKYINRTKRKFFFWDATTINIMFG